MSDDDAPQDRMLSLLDAALVAYRHGRIDDALLLLRNTLKTAQGPDRQQKESRRDVG